MDVKNGDQETVTLLPANMTLKQSRDMTQFSITDYVLMNAIHPDTGIQMVIRLKRKIMSEMMTTYFPSILLMLITFATTIFKDEYFEASLSVNLTTMLVMTTIFISKMEGLPPTSDIKMIDMWLVMGQLVPFIEVIIATFIELYREVSKEEEKEEDDGMDMNMSMVLADLYVAKMDSKMDIPEDKPEEKKDESEEVGVGSKKSSFLNSLREKHNNEGLIVPHLHFIGNHLSWKGS